MKLHVDNRSCRCRACERKATRLVTQRLRDDLIYLDGTEAGKGRPWQELLDVKAKVLNDLARHDFQIRRRQEGTGRLVVRPLPPQPTTEPKTKAGDTHPDEGTITKEAYERGQVSFDFLTPPPTASPEQRSADGWDRTAGKPLSEPQALVPV